MGATADRAYDLLTKNDNMDSFYNQLLGTPPVKGDPYPWGVSHLVPRQSAKGTIEADRLKIDPYRWPLRCCRRPGR